MLAGSLGARVRRWIAAAFFPTLLSGCTLPSEQLQIPGPISGSIAKPAISTNNQRYGVPLSDPAATQTQADRVFEGTGNFTDASLAPGSKQAGGPSVSETAEGVTLNIDGATVDEFAQAVLSNILKLNYTVSEQAKATITLRTPQPIAKDKLLDLFISILQAEGIGVVERAGVYVIAPTEKVAQSGAPASWSGNSGGRGSGTQAIPLRYVAAAEMERIVLSVAPGTRVLRSDGERNMLIVSGNQSELESINETVKVFDVDWMRGMSIAILPVETGNPEAIARELDTIFGNDRDSPGKGIVRFVPNQRLRSVMAISSRPEYIKKAENWMHRIDIAGQATEKQVHVYHVQNRPAAELAVLLRKVYVTARHTQSSSMPLTEPGGETTVLTSPELVPPADSAGTSDAQAAATIPGMPAAVPAQPQAPAKEAETLDGAGPPKEGQVAGGQLQEFGPGDDRASGISVVADVANNSLIITATHNEYRRIRDILARTDVAPNQVLLEATIAEVTLNDQLQYGIKWFFQAKASEFALTNSVLGAVAPTFPGFSYFLNTPNVQVALDALSRVTDVNVVSSPSLTVLDNKKAVLQIGDQVPIATQQQQSILSPGAPIVNSIAFRDTGVILGITPRIGDNGRVLLDIEQEVSDVIETTTSDLNSPTIQQRRIRTTVAVNDGESIVLAGLMQDRSNVTKSQIPLLGDIPVVGNMFKTKDNTIRRTELLIALTPHILKDPSQILSVVSEFRDRMNFTTRPQRVGPPDRRENVERLLVR